MYKKLTYNKWLVQFENFNSMAHFKKYVHSLSPSKLVWENVSQYYKNEYEIWFNENFKEVI